MKGVVSNLRNRGCGSSFYLCIGVKASCCWVDIRSDESLDFIPDIRNENSLIKLGGQSVGFVSQLKIFLESSNVQTNTLLVPSISKGSSSAGTRGERFVLRTQLGFVFLGYHPHLVKRFSFSAPVPATAARVQYWTSGSLLSLIVSVSGSPDPFASLSVFLCLYYMRAGGENPLANYMEKTPKFCTNVVLKCAGQLRYNEKGGVSFGTSPFWPRAGFPGAGICVTSVRAR